MRRFKYTGTEPIDLPALDLVEVTTGTHVESDDTDVSDSLAARDDFEHLPDPKRSAAAKSAATAAEED